MADLLAKLNAFVTGATCQEALAPLSAGARIGLEIEALGSFTLEKKAKKLHLVEGALPEPDFTLQTTAEGVASLLEGNWDVPGLALEVAQRLLASDARRIAVRVHIGPFDLFAKGYLSVLLAGGKPMMNYLASRGFSDISKIKNALAALKEKK